MNNMAFICSPYGGKPENIILARRFMRMAVAAGMVPISLSVMFHGILDDHNPAERAQGMEAGHRLMELCGKMWVCGDASTPGMDIDYQMWRTKRGPGSVRWIRLADMEAWEAGA